MNGHRYAIEYGPSALDDLDRLPARERAQILRKMNDCDMVCAATQALASAEAMYRLRMGDYRV